MLRCIVEDADRGTGGQSGGCHRRHSGRCVSLRWDGGTWGGQEEPRAVVSNRAQLCLPGDIWQYLQTVSFCGNWEGVVVLASNG